MNVELFSLEGTGLESGAAINFHPLRETATRLSHSLTMPEQSLFALDADLWEVSQHVGNLRDMARISVCWDATANGYRLVLWSASLSLIHSMTPAFVPSADFVHFNLGGRVSVTVHSEQVVSGIPAPIVCLSTLTYGASVFDLSAETLMPAESVVPTWEIVPQIN